MTDPDIEEYLLEMQESFVDACADQVEEIETILESVHRAIKTGIQAHDFSAEIQAIRRIAHSMKGQGQTFGFPAISVISHRLEDYLSNTSKSLSAGQAYDVQIFLDRIRDSLNKKSCSLTPELTVADMVRALPVWKESKTKSPVAGKAVEVLLVMSKGLQKKMIDHELSVHGCRVTNVASGTQAIEIAMQTKPDIILSSYVIDGLINGVELARIFSVLDATKNIPFVLLSTYERNDPLLNGLPQGSLTAHKNEHFSADFKKCMDSLNSNNFLMPKGVK